MKKIIMKKNIKKENPLLKLSEMELNELITNVANSFSKGTSDNKVLFDYTQHQDVYSEYIEYFKEQEKVVIKINEQEFKLNAHTMKVYFQVLITQELMQRGFTINLI